MNYILFGSHFILLKFNSESLEIKNTDKTVFTEQKQIQQKKLQKMAQFCLWRHPFFLFQAISHKMWAIMIVNNMYRIKSSVNKEQRKREPSTDKRHILCV